MQKALNLNPLPFYIAAVLSAVPGIFMLTLGLGGVPQDLNRLEQMSGTVTSISWNTAPGSDTDVSMLLALKGANRVFQLNSHDVAQREKFERLIGVSVDVWFDNPVDATNEPILLQRLVATNDSRAGVQSLIIDYDHQGGGQAKRDSHVKWGAILMTFAAGLVVVGRLVDVWNRHRFEIMGR